MDAHIINSIFKNYDEKSKPKQKLKRTGGGVRSVLSLC